MKSRPLVILSVLLCLLGVLVAGEARSQTASVVGNWVMTKRLDTEGMFWVSDVEFKSDGTFTDASAVPHPPGADAGTWSLTPPDSIFLWYPHAAIFLDAIVSSDGTYMAGVIDNGVLGDFWASRRVATPCASLGTIGVASTQDFDTLAATATSDILPTGWAFAESGSPANSTYDAGTGSSSVGGTYSFGASGSTERAFGGLRGEHVVPTIGACFTNDTGVTITSLDVAYAGEQWRIGVTNRNAADRVDFQYGTDATFLTTGTWTDVDALDYSSTVINGIAGPLDGNEAANRMTVSSSIGGLSIPNGATVWIRWTDFDIADSDDGLAVDDFSLTPHGVASADLSVAASAAPAAVAPGAPFVHTATVTNLGPSDSTGSTLTLSLPAGAVASTVTPGACVPAGATVTCTVGPLALDATFTATVEMTAGTTGTYVTTATVVGADADTVPANDTATASTAIGQVVATPSPVNMRVPIFTAGGAMTLNLLNDSPIPVGFTLLERPIEYTWLRFPINGPTWNVPAADSYARTARAVPQHPRPSLPAVELAPIATLDFPTGLVYPWGIGFNTLANDMWVHDIADAGGDGFNHRFLTDGTDTGDTIDTSSWIGDWAADLAYDPWNDKLWQINVGNGNCVHEMDPLTKTSTGNSICPAFPVSQRGLAFDPVSDTFFAGSWNDGAILRFDRTGEILETVSAGLDVSGLAYNPGTGHLFVLTNTDAAADLFVLDANNGYATVGSFKIAGMADYDQAGLDADCAGNLYAVNQGTGEVLVVASGETGFCSYSTVPWLDETPKSGAIAAGATQAVTLDFTTALQWPGLHQANLRVAGTDPFPSSEVPVNFTISFLDVPDDYWSDSYIHALAGARITRGCGEGNYCPTATIDRAQMAVLIVRAMHGPLYAPPSATGIFSDVVISDTDTTADYIEQLYRDGVVAGCGTSPLRYCPTDLVNRAQMSVFVAKGLGLPVASPTGYFTDVSGTIYNGFAPYAEALFNANVTAGCGDHVFCPASEITRAELAVWLVKALGLPMAP